MEEEVYIRLSAELKSQLSAMAKAKGLNLSSYLRMVLTDHAKEKTKGG